MSQYLGKGGVQYQVVGSLVCTVVYMMFRSLSILPILTQTKQGISGIWPQKWFGLV